jgi:hypothetical protein
MSTLRVRVRTGRHLCVSGSKGFPMETRAINLSCAAMAGLSARPNNVNAGGGGELFTPMKPSCARECSDYCKAAMPSAQLTIPIHGSLRPSAGLRFERQQLGVVT